MRISDWSSDVCSSDLLMIASAMCSSALILNLPFQVRSGLRLLPDQAKCHTSERRARSYRPPPSTVGKVHPSESLHCLQSVFRKPERDRGQYPDGRQVEAARRSEEHTSELQSLMRISYAVFCLTKKIRQYTKMYIRYTQ